MTDDNMRTDRWPECIQCGSDDTSVVPLTGEWTCGDCGCQWTYDEIDEDDEQAEEIPTLIEGMLDALAGEDNE